MEIKYPNEVLKTIALRIAKEFLESGNGMKNHMLMDILDALEKGENVDDGLVDLILTRPFMERFMEELLKYEEE